MKNNKGFSLVELVVVIAIMAILIGVSVPVFTSYIEKSEIATDKSNVGELVRNIEVAGKTHAFKIDDVAQVSSDGLQVPVGFIVLSNKMLQKKDNSDILQDVGYVYTLTFGDNDFLREILVGTYGENYIEDLRLISDAWTGSNISGLYAETDTFYKDVKTFSEYLSSRTAVSAINIALRLSGSSQKFNRYESGVQAVNTVAKEFVGKYKAIEDGEKTFESVWKGVGSNTNYTFGMSTLEGHMAVRMAYNQAVENYVYSQTKCEHAKKISDYGLGIEGYFNAPDCICVESFVSDGTGLKNFLNDELQACDKCKTAVGNYPTSSAAKNDAKAFYQVMQTLAADSPEMQQALNDKSWAPFDSHISDFSTLYKNLESITENLSEDQSCVVVTVYCDPTTKELYCEVSPSSILEDS